MLKVLSPKLRSKESPRQIIFEDFKSLGTELPIKGGWGYEINDAVIINKNDPIVSQSMPFNFTAIEKIFVEKRIYEELIIFREDNQKHSGIEWKLESQKLIRKGNNSYDVLSYLVTAIPDVDWEILKAEFMDNNGFSDSKESYNAHMEKKHNKTIFYSTEYWFDITSCKK